MDKTTTKRVADIDQLKARLSSLYARPDLRLVILFGSQARGITHQRSDFDLAILGDTPLDVVELTNQVMALTHRSDADVVDLRRASPLLAMEVVRYGRLLYEREAGQYVSFCSLAFRRYVDTAKLRSAQKEAIAQFIKSRGLS